jgi:micrococcal nuclease
LKNQLSEYDTFPLGMPVFSHSFVKSIVVLALLLSRAPLLSGQDFSGLVVGVSDGDTLSVMHDGKAEKIRLRGIDAPERGQAFSNRAKQFVSGLCFGKEVTVKARGQDRYQRTIADVILPDGRNLNHEIVRAGFAWWFRKYAPGDETLERLEKEAGRPGLGFGLTSRVRSRHGSGARLLDTNSRIDQCRRKPNPNRPRRRPGNQSLSA